MIYTLVMVDSFNKNFKLLLISRLLQEVVFWYSIFIAFAYSINMTVEQVALSIVAVNIGVIIFEVPSGVLADRWSRKGTLALAMGTLMISSVGFGLSTEASHYIMASFLWGVFFALLSGTAEPLIYDMLKQEGETKQYKKYLGRYHMVGTIGLIVGSIAGGIIADLLSLRSAYFLTLIPCALSLIPLALVSEPKDHQADQNFSSWAHYGVAFKQLIANNTLLLSVLTSVLIISAISFIFELNQVFYFAAGLPIALYGIFNASLQFSIGGGTWLAGQRGGKVAIIAAMSILVLLAATILFQVSLLTSALLSGIMLLLFYITTIHGHFIHDQITSEVRSAASSMISTGGRLVFTALILLFGVINISKNHANGFVILAVVIAVIALLTLKNIAKLASFDKEQRS